MLNKRYHVRAWYASSIPCPLSEDFDVLIPVQDVSVEKIVAAAVPALGKILAESCRSKLEWRHLNPELFSVGLFYDVDLFDGTGRAKTEYKIIWNAYPLGRKAWICVRMPKPSWWWPAPSEEPSKQPPENAEAHPPAQEG